MMIQLCVVVRWSGASVPIPLPTSNLHGSLGWRRQRFSSMAGPCTPR
jgi:hypothetical protein